MIPVVRQIFDACTALTQGGSSAPPKPSHLSAYWHQPQFSKLFDTKTGRDCVAMLITVPEQLFDGDAPDGPDPVQIGMLAKEIDRIVRSKWTNGEAAKAANWFADINARAFVVVLENAATGAYATRTQQVKAYYDFDGKRIGELTPAGKVFENETVYQCVTL